MKQLFFFAFLAISLKLSAQTFSQTFNQTVPDDGSTVMYNVPVSGLQNSIDTNFGLEGVCIILNHTWDDDMEVKLKSPDGSIVLLFSHVGGDGDNFNVTCFNGVSPFLISSGTAPFNSTYRAMGDLGVMNNGQNPNGNWTLILRDTYPFADQGFLIGWGLTFGNQPIVPFPFFSSNLPILKINTGGVVIPNEPKVPADFVIINHGNGVRNFVKDTAYEFKGKILVEQQGYSGPYYPKKNYDFDLIDSAQNEIDTPLLGMPSENDWILKAEYLDGSLMANPLTYEMCRRMGNYAPRTKYCEVTVNDEYMGVYSLTEKVKRSASRVNIAKLKKEDTTGIQLTGGYIIEMNINGDPPAWTSQYPAINNATHSHNVEFKEVYPKQDSIAVQQHHYIKSFVDSFENALMNDSLDPHAWRKLAAEKSFIDFQIADEFSVNYDSYGRSTYMYKEKATDGNKLHIGPSWDYDRAYPVGNTQGWVWEITHQGWPFPFWWSKFNSDSVYLKKLYCRWTTLRMNTLSNDSFLTFVDSTHSLLQESAARNFARWPELGVANYNTSVTNLKSFITARLSWMDANIPAYGEFLPQMNLNDTSACAVSTLGQHKGNQFHYEWSNGDTLPFISVTQSGVYSLSVKDGYGCSATDNANVSILSLPDASFLKTQNSNLNFSFQPVDTSYQTYFWQFGDGFSSNLKSPSYSYSNLGNYTVSLMVTDANGCVSVSVDSISVVSGIAENEFSRARIFPNPFHDFIEIEISSLNTEATIQLKDITGRVIEEKEIVSENTRISTQKLNKGIYFIELRLADKKVNVFKLAKQ